MISIENAHRTFWTYLLLFAGGIGLVTILMVFWDDICDEIETIRWLFFSKDDLNDEEGYFAEDDPDEEERYPRKLVRRKKSIKWRIFIPFLSHRRRKWLEKRDGRRTDRKCKDTVAETIATHEDILEAMYGEAPSMGEIYRRVKDQYRD